MSQSRGAPGPFRATAWRCACAAPTNTGPPALVCKLLLSRRSRTFERELSATPTESFPVSVVMERKDVRRGAWSVPSWRVLAVLTGERLADQPRHKTLLQSADGVNQYLCSGFRIDLYRDAAEHYWFNLTGGRPALFVLCRADESGELQPWRVTADHTETQSLVESGGVAFPAPIPPEVLEVLERFITEHFRPEPARKRRRQRWTDSEKT